ncbi:MFS general substrate transporter, partial [Ramicandelaber brevisporus]
LSLYSFVAMLDATIIISTLPTILPTFHVPVASSISWLVSGCVLTTAIFLPIVSKLCDIVGSKRTFLTTVLLYIVGTTLGGASTSFKMMLIARFIQGIGIAGAVGLTMIIVARMAGTEALGQAFILFGASMTCGSMAGAPLGGVITEHLGWRWTFYISLPIAALAAILVIAFLRVPLEPGKKKAVWRDIDYGGALLFTTSATTFLLPTIWGGDDFPWNSAPVISCYVVSAVTLAAFVYWEAYHARDPFLPMNLFRNRTFVIASFIQLSTGAMMTVLLVYSVLYLQLVRGKSQLDTSLLTTPYMVAATISGCAVGAVNQRFKVYREPTIVGLALFIVGAGVCLTWSTGHSPTVDGLLLIPAGFAGGLAACGSLLGGMQSVDPSQLAPATGFIDFSRCIGGAIGVAIAS